MKAIDLTGKRFGRLVVTRRASNSPGSGQARWHCACDCGGTTTTSGSNLRRRTISCGCAHDDANTRRLRTHGMSRSGGKPGHEVYDIWLGIRRRCLVGSAPHFARYGGRGITIAEVWRNDFARFARDIGPRPSKHYSLDRIDNDGNYEPGNIRWATAQEQADNRGPVARLRRENRALCDEVERLTRERDEAAEQLAIAPRPCCGEYETGSGQHGDECPIGEAIDRLSEERDVGQKKAKRWARSYVAAILSAICPDSENLSAESQWRRLQSAADGDGELTDAIRDAEVHGPDDLAGWEEW